MENKEYKELPVSLGSSIQTVVEELLAHKAEGELVKMKFNDHMLYSDTVDMDSAYLQITGKTFAEFNKVTEDRMAEYDRRQREHEEKIPALIEQYKAEGRTVIEESKWEQWDEIIPIRLSDLYQGRELGAFMEIATILKNDGSLEDAKQAIFDQGHSGTSFHLVRHMVRMFSPRGEEFSEYVS